MNEIVAFVISVLGYLTLFGQIIIVVLLVLLIFPKKKKSRLADLHAIFKQNALTFIFLVASIATFGSLFLSEVALYVPCKLCWWQRIFMYPTALVSLVALIKNDRGAIKYILPLSAIGALIATYHYIMQLFPNMLECSEEVAKCSTIQFAQFGYITIPVMALTAFVLLALSSLILLRK